LAQQKEDAGLASLNRQDAAAAKQSFQEANQAYKRAGQEAVAEKQRRDAVDRQQAEAAEKLRRDAAEQQRVAATEQQKVAAVQRQQVVAEQARAGMTTAKRAAEQARAGQFAAKVIASAQQKESEGGAAFQRPDYEVAAKSFSEATAFYQEARREAETLAASLDQSLRWMGGKRDDAVKAEAGRFAKEQFDAAQAKQAEADGLVRTSNFAAAANAYQDAAQRYMEAGLRAGITREAAEAKAQADAKAQAEAKAQADARARQEAKVQEEAANRAQALAKLQADGARKLMLNEKDKADKASREFAEALSLEKEGNSLYDRLKFEEAVEKFQAAEKLFVKVRAKRYFPPPS
jgi:hypothetical protein